MDYYESNKKNQFKDIQLQLHASTVSNPYTFSIQGNKSFSGSCVVDLPTSDTMLFDGAKYGTTNITITIPTGVKVLKCYGLARSTSDEYGTEASIYNRSSDKYWVYVYQGGYGTDSNITYVGVTSGKTYNLDITQNIEDDGDVLVQIYYSASINNHSVEVADY